MHTAALIFAIWFIGACLLAPLLGRLFAISNPDEPEPDGTAPSLLGNQDELRSHTTRIVTEAVQDHV